MRRALTIGLFLVFIVATSGISHAKCELVSAEIPVFFPDPSNPRGGGNDLRNGLIVANFRDDGSVTLPDATDARVRIVPEMSSGLRPVTLSLAPVKEGEVVVHVRTFMFLRKGTRVVDVEDGRQGVQVARFSELPPGYLSVQATARVVRSGKLGESCQGAAIRAPVLRPVYIGTHLRRLVFRRLVAVSPFKGLLAYPPIPRP